MRQCKKLMYLTLTGLYELFEFSYLSSGISDDLLHLRLMKGVEGIHLCLVIFIARVEVVDDLRQLSDLFAHLVVQVRENFRAAPGCRSRSGRWC